MSERPRSLGVKIARDRSLGYSWFAILRKAISYCVALLTAPFYLRAVNKVGAGARTTGRPRIENFGTIIIGERAILRSTVLPLELVTGPQGVLTLGDDVFLNFGVSIAAMGRVEIRSRAKLGPYVMVIDTEFHGIHDRLTMPEPRPVLIEEDVWIGAKATILPGVTIGRGAVVGASAVVTENVPPYTVVAELQFRVSHCLVRGKRGGGAGARGMRPLLVHR